MEESNAPKQRARKLQRAAPADAMLLQCAGVTQLLATKDEAESLSWEARLVAQIGFDRDGCVAGVDISVTVFPDSVLTKIWMEEGVVCMFVNHSSTTPTFSFCVNVCINDHSLHLPAAATQRCYCCFRDS
jgi:hypothetical protein